MQPIYFLKLQTIIPHRNQCALPQAWVGTELQGRLRLSVWAGVELDQHRRKSLRK